MRAAFLILCGLAASVAHLSAQQSRFLVTVEARDDSAVGRSPLPGARVQVLLNDTVVAVGTSDGLGTVSLVVSAGKSYRVEATLIGFRPAYRDVSEIYASPGDVEVLASLVLDEPLPTPDELERDVQRPWFQSLVGRVVSEDGHPVANLLVHVSPGPYSASTKPDGSFWVAVLPGPYRVSTQGRLAPAPGGPIPATEVGYEGSEASVTVFPGRRGGPVVLRLKPIPMFAVTVRVTNDRGEPIPDAEVEAAYTRRQVSIDAFSRADIHVRTSADGTARLGRISNGPVSVFASVGDGAGALSGALDLEVTGAPQHDVRIVMHPASSLVGRIEYIGRDQPLHSVFGIRVLSRVADAALPSFSSDDPSGLMGADGSFALLKLAGHRCLAVTGLPYPWRVHDVTYRGEDFTNRAFRFDPGLVVSGVLVRVEQRETAPTLTAECQR